MAFLTRFKLTGDYKPTLGSHHLYKKDLLIRPMSDELAHQSGSNPLTNLDRSNARVDGRQIKQAKP